MSTGDLRTEVDHDGMQRIADFCRVGISRTSVDAMAVLFSTSFARLELLYATDDLAERVAQSEFVVGEGPCRDAVRSSLPTVVEDLSTSIGRRRWPVFAHEAMEAGARSVQAYPMRFSRGALGAVGFYSSRPSRLTSDEHRSAAAIAELIGLALVDPEAGIGAGLAFRMTVHQAAGMVMQQAGVSIEEALMRLRMAAFTEDLRITDLAADVIEGRRRFQQTGENDG